MPARPPRRRLPPSGRRIILAGGLFLGYAVLTALVTWPQAAVLDRDCFATDCLASVWNFPYVWRRLTTAPLQLLDSNILYPLHHSLLINEIGGIGLLPWFGPALALTGDPVLTLNWMRLTGYASTACAVHLWVWWWLRDHRAAVVVAVAVGFLGNRFSEYEYLHMAHMEYTIAALLFTERFLRTERVHNLVLAAAVAFVQVLAAFYNGLGLLIALVVYLGATAAWRRRMFTRRTMIALALTGVCSGVAVLILFAPYFDLAARGGYGLKTETAITLAPEIPGSFLMTVPGGMNYPWLGLPTAFRPWALFPGLVPLVLIVAGCGVREPRDAHAHTGDRMTAADRKTCLAMTAMLFVLGLGPVLKIGGRVTGVPLPGAIFAEGVPGLEGVRFAYRYIFFALVLSAPIMGYGAHRLLHACSARAQSKTLRRAFQWTLAGVLAGGNLWESWPTWDSYAYRVSQAITKKRMLERTLTPFDFTTLPPAYQWVQDNADAITGGVLDLPYGIPQPDRYKTNEPLYAAYASQHHVPIVGGLAAYWPEMSGPIDAALTTPDLAGGIEFLALLDIRTLIWHPDITAWARPLDIVDAINTRGRLGLTATPLRNSGIHIQPRPAQDPPVAVLEVPAGVMRWLLWTYPEASHRPWSDLSRGLAIEAVVTPPDGLAGNRVRMWLPHDARRLPPEFSAALDHARITFNDVGPYPIALPAAMRAQFPVGVLVEDFLPFPAPTRPNRYPLLQASDADLQALGVTVDRTHPPDVIYRLPPPPPHTTTLDLGVPYWYGVATTDDFLAIDIAGADGRRWVNPQPTLGLQYHVTVHWEHVSGAPRRAEQVVLPLPLVIDAGAAPRLFVRFTPPVTPGIYKLTLTPDAEFLTPAWGFVEVKPGASPS